MKRVLLLFCAICIKQILFAQYSTPTIDGAISSNEYGTHTDGQNKQGNFYMTWDGTNLYVGITTSNVSEGAVLYLDKDPLSTVNGGTNSNGNLAGFNYDGTSFTNLPFRADLVVYFKNGYREYRTANGSGGWSNATSAFGSYSNNSGTNTREVAIPWSAIGGIPGSFNMFSYVTSSGGFVYNQVPTTNAGGNIGTTATYNYYYTVSSTTNGSATKPYSRLSYATNTTATISSTNSLYDLTVNAGITLTLAATQSVTNNVTVSGNSTLSAGGYLTLLSTSTATAKIPTVSGSITGNVTIQRYIPGGRRTNRFLSHPFSNALSMSSLIDNIYVTGTGGASNGFDATTTNNPSSYWFNNGTQAWADFTHASTDANWTQYRGIRVLVRGDRTQSTALTGGNPTPNPVTLDFTGTLNTGNQAVAVPTGYSVLGNPYPSPINLGARLNATTNIGTQFWYWDANAGVSAGAYRTRLIGVSENSTLPVGGAFVVQPASATTINFVEADKVATDSTNLFRTTTQSGVVELEVLYNNYHADNLFVRFNNNSNDNKDALDGEKLNNPEVNIYALSNDSKQLSLDTRPFADNKIIPLGFTATAANSFTLKVADYGINEIIYLKDKFLNTTTLLSAGATYTFSVDPANAATLGENRFELVMRSSNALPVTFLSVSAAQKNGGIEVNWNTANETNMSSYEVEESNDGINFTKATTVAAKNAASNSYNWLDAAINNGDNFYRIKSVEQNGTFKYSNLVKVKVGGKHTEFTVYPNPVKGGVVNLQMTNAEKGIYTVKIYNKAGQELASKSINHNGGSASQTIQLNAGIAAGTYSMQVSNGTTVITKTVIVE